MRIGYFASENKTEYDESVFLTKLKSIIDNEKFAIDAKKVSEINNSDQFDLMICFGDDSVLTFIQNFGETCPILCIELPGDNSFFAESTLSDLGEKLSKFLVNQHLVQDYHLMKIEFNENSVYALNDIYIGSGETNTRIRFDIEIDGVSLLDDLESANAILVSTSIGSTAMAMNLGGPFIHSSAQVYQIQTIASRNLYSNHFIVGDTSSIGINISEALPPLLVQFDNRRIKTKFEELKISKSDRKVTFVKFDTTKENTIGQKLLNKLNFEDTASLTSSAKFILHVLQNENREFNVSEIAEITHIDNPKTLRNSLNLLMKKGFVKRKANLTDLREYLYSFNEFRDFD